MTEISQTPRILIAGAGVGGLALAQALRRGGFDVAVHEQDPTPRIRNQGFRIHIDPNGNRALRACLPPAVFALVRDISGADDDTVAMYTDQRKPLPPNCFRAHAESSRSSRPWPPAKPSCSPGFRDHGQCPRHGRPALRPHRMT
ncbi:FAD-dependent oxidoreductase [Nocardia sp. NBC_01503]|uniref:FAD-dependent oxidoreductase n=1 Tax=Nocardia sp. NBC_01503 TaxID=2975997 RepID=UPI003FA52CDF